MIQYDPHKRREEATWLITLIKNSKHSSNPSSLQHHHPHRINLSLVWIKN